MNLKHILIGSFAVVTLCVGGLLLNSTADAAKDACPISGKPGNKDHSLNVNGELVYFCCGGCPKKYKKETLNLKGEGKVGNCPISGKPGKAEQLTTQEFL